MRIEMDREDDGRWIAEVPDLPGVMVYGASREEAIPQVEALALVPWRTDSTTARRFRNFEKCLRCPRRPLALDKSEPCARRPPVTDRFGDRASPALRTECSARVVGPTTFSLFMIARDRSSHDLLE